VGNGAVPDRTAAADMIVRRQLLLNTAKQFPSPERPGKLKPSTNAMSLSLFAFLCHQDRIWFNINFHLIFVVIVSGTAQVITAQMADQAFRAVIKFYQPLHTPSHTATVQRLYRR